MPAQRGRAGEDTGGYWLQRGRLRPQRRHFGEVTSRTRQQRPYATEPPRSPGSRRLRFMPGRSRGQAPARYWHGVVTTGRRVVYGYCTSWVGSQVTRLCESRGAAVGTAVVLAATLVLDRAAAYRCLFLAMNTACRAGDWVHVRQANSYLGVPLGRLPSGNRSTWSKSWNWLDRASLIRPSRVIGSGQADGAVADISGERRHPPGSRRAAVCGCARGAPDSIAAESQQRQRLAPAIRTGWPQPGGD
jgi:hypothetical protein